MCPWNKHENLNIHVCFKHRDKIELEYIIKGVEGLDNEWDFVKSLYESIVKENLQLNKNLYETTNVTPKTDDYWKEILVFTIV